LRPFYTEVCYVFLARGSYPFSCLIKDLAQDRADRIGKADVTDNSITEEGTRTTGGPVDKLIGNDQSQVD
jgi:hypothetical protein